MTGVLAGPSRWLALAVVALVAGPAEAQQRRLEIGGTVGWTLSDGVRGRLRGTSGLPVNGIAPDDGLSYSLFASYFVNENIQLGRQAARQESELRVTGETDREIGAMDVESYHVVSTTLLGDDELWARPYFLFGVGVTRFGRANFTGLDGLPRSFKPRMRFSPTIGTGVKFYLRPRNKYGLNLGVRWTPTFLHSGSEGFWCDPYWGCFLTNNSQFAHQVELGGGVQVRF